MKKPVAFIGIDVSKSTLDVCVLSSKGLSHCQITNTHQAIEKLFSQFDPEQTIIAMENTGRYNWPLYETLADKLFGVYVVSPLHLKRSMGLTRGKNDEIDAQRIAVFIQKHYQDLKPWQAESKCIKHLKLLVTERKQLLKQSSQVQVALKERYLIQDAVFRKQAEKRDRKRIKELKALLTELEKQIIQLIQTDEQLKQTADWVQSVPGVGKVLCWNLLAKTNGFKSINDPRKLACYSGIAPFDFQSGTSIKRRPGVSNLADKKLKTVLHLAAMVAVRIDPDLKKYYHRKVDEGKNKMAVLNAVRNKIIHRVCAVVRDQRYFQQQHLQLS